MPLALTQFVKHNHVLHERVLLVTVLIEESPHIADEDRAEVFEIIPGHHAGHSALRFMQYPTIYGGLILACNQGKLPGIDLGDITYYVGRETIIPREDVPGMWVWPKRVRLPAAQRRTLRRVLRRADQAGRRVRNRDRD